MFLVVQESKITFQLVLAWPRVVSQLIMESQLLNIAANTFSGLGTEPNNFEASLMDFLGQHVNHHIGRSTDQDLFLTVFMHPDVNCPRKMVYDAGTSDSLASPWGPLDQT